MEYHSAAEKNVRPNCTDMEGGHEIKAKKSRVRKMMSSLTSFKKITNILLCAKDNF
jgi:hypothetical protein